MDAIEFCKTLSKRIAPEEWQALERTDNELLVNDHNRLALLEMREVGQGLNGVILNSRMAPGGENGAGADSSCADESDCRSDVDIDSVDVAALENELQAFLDEHMADAPEGHKWIVIASLYLTYVAKRPMHPIERAGVVVEERDGRAVYFCPNKVLGDNPICDACVCVAAQSLG